MMDPLSVTRRQFFSKTSAGIGAAALASLLPRDAMATGLAGFPNFPAKAKRVIYLHQSGAPSQIDLFDYKPKLDKLHGSELPNSDACGPFRCQTLTSATGFGPPSGVTAER